MEAAGGAAAASPDGAAPGRIAAGAAFSATHGGAEGSAEAAEGARWASYGSWSPATHAGCCGLRRC